MGIGRGRFENVESALGRHIIDFTVLYIKSLSLAVALHVNVEGTQHVIIITSYNVNKFEIIPVTYSYCSVLY